ncbi:hypothetical protein BHE74_00024633 [Ensete ventricosum]|uniref:Uncharacterized protein n=1 Tax=Ensete ventricosum TaxID=4639 RepID=A0A426YF79_ENSVE|nr:hypothetical protein B296_00020899 [Ensete ventricosum]RWW23747.1 hypothetical protein GW17_00011994 [Ensete ventricosum]RWW67890.1 hypothetical protein BHE74_00024633 [Ensete ventricosum]
MGARWWLCCFPKETSAHRPHSSPSSDPLPHPTSSAPPAGPPFVSIPSAAAGSTKEMGAKLPYAHVDARLRALAGQAEGFGRHAIGGLHGPVYHVTSLAGSLPSPSSASLLLNLILPYDCEDDGPGSLREACRIREPLWIIFEISGTIHLSSYLRVSSYKTIDGRGQRIKLIGKGLQLKECEHIIICNLEFEGGRGHDVDGIQIKPKSRHIWIDRCSLRDYDDGLIDITRESTDITVSR